MQELLLVILIFIVNLVFLWLALLVRRFAWYRFAGYLLILLIPLALVCPAQPVFALDYFWWRIAGVAAIVAGLALALWAVLELQKSGARWHDAAPAVLVTSGPYQFVRHPIYLGKVFMLVGWWWIWGEAYAFYFGMIVLALIWLHAYLEEKLVLEKKFGQKYLEYRQRTGMFWIK